MKNSKDLSLDAILKSVKILEQTLPKEPVFETVTKTGTANDFNDITCSLEYLQATSEATRKPHYINGMEDFYNDDGSISIGGYQSGYELKIDSGIYKYKDQASGVEISYNSSTKLYKMTYTVKQEPLKKALIEILSQAPYEEFSQLLLLTSSMQRWSIDELKEKIVRFHPETIEKKRLAAQKKQNETLQAFNEEIGLDLTGIFSNSEISKVIKNKTSFKKAIKQGFSLDMWKNTPESIRQILLGNLGGLVCLLDAHITPLHIQSIQNKDQLRYFVKNSKKVSNFLALGFTIVQLFAITNLDNLKQIMPHQNKVVPLMSLFQMEINQLANLDTKQLKLFLTKSNQVQALINADIEPQALMALEHGTLEKMLKQSKAVVDILDTGKVNFQQLSELRGLWALYILKHQKETIALFDAGVSFDDIKQIPERKVESVVKYGRAIASLLQTGKVTLKDYVETGGLWAYYLKKHSKETIALFDAGVSFEDIKQIPERKVESVVKYGCTIASLIQTGKVNLKDYVETGGLWAYYLRKYSKQAIALFDAGVSFEDIKQIPEREVEVVLENGKGLAQVLQNSSATFSDLTKMSGKNFNTICRYSAAAQSLITAGISIEDMIHLPNEKMLNILKNADTLIKISQHKNGESLETILALDDEKLNKVLNNSTKLLKAIESFPFKVLLHLDETPSVENKKGGPRI